MKSSSEILWNKAIVRLKHLIDSQSFGTWIVPIKFKSYANNIFTLEVPSKFYKRWVLTNYITRITNVLRQLTNSECNVVINCPDEDSEMDTPDMFMRTSANSASSAGNAEPQEKTEESLSLFNLRLNPNYTFDNFVVGESNRFANAVAHAVADSSTKGYNPLFIYGGVGLGKTHLMQAIGHQIRTVAGDTKVIYISSEQFMNSFIDSISQNKQVEFRNRFRSVDLLLIDDVQFFIGKDRTQTEFFHTFNALYDASKKIVISSDRPPKELASLEERLRSRFEWGIIVDIQMPDLETRMAILKKKSEQQHISVPSEVLYFIAEQITSNIRELEGSLQRIKAYAELHHCEITLELAKKLLSHLTRKEEKKEVSIEDIISAVSQYYDIRSQEILGSCREKRVAIPRHVAQYLARELTLLSLPRIGMVFGGKDHTSILHACRKIEIQQEKDPVLKNAIMFLTNQLRGDSYNSID